MAEHFYFFQCVVFGRYIPGKPTRAFVCPQAFAQNNLKIDHLAERQTLKRRFGGNVPRRKLP
jgi:hypothetical protein